VSGSRTTARCVLRASGLVQRRRGRWGEALAAQRAAAELDPGSSVRAQDVGDTYFSVRDYAAAERYLDRATALSPEWPLPYAYKASLAVVWRGDLAGAREIVHQALERMEFGQLAPSLIANNATSASIITSDSTLWPAIDALSLRTFDGDTSKYFLLHAEAYRYQDRAAAMRVYADSARMALESSLRTFPDDHNVHRELGLAYAFLGRREEALREARRAAQLLPMTRDANSGPFMVSSLARVHTVLGEPDSAVAQLAPLLAVPSWISIPALRVDPEWTPLHHSAAFRRLVHGDS
jgi:tetratricopeptide (TPR) repeat protein